ncbi:MAG: flagellar export chaperone FliS [Oscillospiraceae bacterium]
MKNAYQQYIDQSISTMTQGEMVVRLYDEIINQLNRAKIHIEDNDIENTNVSIQKIQRILNHLIATLDFQYDISKNLSSLYQFFLQRTLMAHVKKDITIINEILPLMIELKDTFAEGERLSRIK